MTTYIAFLRGINVSGQKKINMLDLKKMCEALSFTNVLTYIQSGNVVFKSSEEEAAINAKIETAIVENYAFEVPVISRTLADLEKCLASNAFADRETKNLYFTCLAEEPTPEKVAAILKKSFFSDVFQIVGKDIYLFVEAYGKTKLSNLFFENELKINATTRNWNTMHEVLLLAKSI